MAEGYVRAIAGSAYGVASAGTEPAHVQSSAIRAMQEVGLISLDTPPKALSLSWGRGTLCPAVCDQASESCAIPLPAPEALGHGIGLCERDAGNVIHEPIGRGANSLFDGLP